MVKSVEELKAIVTDKMVMKAGSNIVTIRRYPNNIIKIHNRSVKWTVLQDLLANSNYQLDIQEEQPEMFTRIKRGGQRVAGPGKTLGRNPIDPGKKKKIVSLSLSPDVIDALNTLAQEKGCSRSQYVEMLINYESGKNVSIIF